MKTVTDGLVFALNPELRSDDGRHRSRDAAALQTQIQWECAEGGTLLRASELPAAGVATGSFLQLLCAAYNRHLPVSLAPHDLWYVLMTELAAEVNAKSDQYRALFTRSPEKIFIAVLSNDPSDLPLESVEQELRQKVPVDMDLFLPRFSTETPDVRVACLAAFADMVKSYYSYGTFACGIPSIEIRGTYEDWSLFVDRVRDLRQTMRPLDEYLGRVGARVKQIADLYVGGDPSFLKSIFTSRNIGSGGELRVDGWFVKDFFRDGGGDYPKLENLPKMWSVVPFMNLETGRTFVDVVGCFYSQPTDDYQHFHRGVYGRLTFETRPEVKEARLKEEKRRMAEWRSRRS